MCILNIIVPRALLCNYVNLSSVTETKRPSESYSYGQKDVLPEKWWLVDEERWNGCVLSMWRPAPPRKLCLKHWAVSFGFWLPQTFPLSQMTPGHKVRDQLSVYCQKSQAYQKAYHGPTLAKRIPESREKIVFVILRCQKVFHDPRLGKDLAGVRLIRVVADRHPSHPSVTVRSMDHRCGSRTDIFFRKSWDWRLTKFISDGFQYSVWYLDICEHV